MYPAVCRAVLHTSASSAIAAPSTSLIAVAGRGFALWENATSPSSSPTMCRRGRASACEWLTRAPAPRAPLASRASQTTEIASDLRLFPPGLVHLALSAARALLPWLAYHGNRFESVDVLNSLESSALYTSCPPRSMCPHFGAVVCPASSHCVTMCVSEGSSRWTAK